MGEKIMDPQKVADRMRGLCSRREYCRQDIMKKVLAALGGDADEAGRIMDRLVEENYIDDLRYASAFARDKSSIAGWGATKIRYMLAAKGIDRETIAAALQEVDEGKASDRLEKLLSAKVRSLKDDPQCRMKLLRFALGRGYQYDEAAEVIDRLLNERD
ncbi:MAG: RecX family transcriptional regulator [Bacteroidales bacterium]|nr:RecX family transcriptional regulator [Bacteroidales bacterium]